ncbi:S9 family peptidase [Pacificimonas sp. WHA3]|uniref:S9 family peptidase n=1 Tax=Pacificimonas pallii TaxID=2827236 RepID=A0ABS6SHR4_9SPHN|nr:prolyl oligopeptidase family serine peptidase [Pacificimonas pallii]MBV7257456.1 S9 family peptidase [Pacificimonas pallii]
MTKSLTAIAGVYAVLMVGGAGGAAAQERRTEGQLVIEGVPEIPAELAQQVQRYRNVRSHAFRDFLPDGSMLISTRFGETSQVHRLTAPMGVRSQLTFYNEPVRGITANPAGQSYVFSRDSGGDEFFQLFTHDLATGTVMGFTTPGERNSFAVWSDDGAKIAYNVARASEPDWKINVVQKAAGQDTEAVPQTLYAGEGANYPLDWSADGKTLLVQRYVSNSKSHLYLVEEEGEAREILADENNAYSGGDILSDGSILIVTDREADMVNLVQVKPDGSVINLTAPVLWDVSGYAVSPDETRIALTINEGGLGSIRMLDLETGMISAGPELPAGIASGLGWHPDGEQLGFTFNAATSPSDAWVWNVRSGELTRWTKAELGGLSEERFVEPELIAYPNKDDMQIPAFVYRPKGAGPHPVLISIHGGPASQARPGFSSTRQYLASELGIAVIRPNVRGSTGYGQNYMNADNGLLRKKSVEDIGALLDWIETQDDLDASRVVVSGGSYGGYMVLASMVDYGERLAGGIDMVGISDFRTFLQNTKGYRRDLRRVEYGDERDPDIAAFFDRISPLKNADKITKPLFILQGANDPRVPASEAEQILAAVKSQGTKAWFVMAMDEGHGFRKKANQDYRLAAETLFLRDVLGLGAK